MYTLFKSKLTTLFLVAAVIGLGPLVFVNSSLSDKRPMTGDEIKSVFSGSKWEGLTRRNQTFYTIMHLDGSFEYLNTESQWNDSGK